MHIFRGMDSPSSTRELSSATPQAGPVSGHDDQRWNGRLWATLIVLCGALFVDGLDVSMVGVALPAIRSDLGLSTTSLQWIVSGYVLGYGGLLLLGGPAAGPPTCSAAVVSSWRRWACSRRPRCSAAW